jgi:transcriptional regulator with PAS, ATPase and Fis domain
MFQLAQGGTIFLTEIGDLPLPLQVKLLTVLDDREFFPLGSQKKVRVDVRLVTGTHRDLRQLVQEGRFREDLFFRLNVLRVHLPPLRERDGDVRLLIDHFLQMFAAGFGKNVKRLSAQALRLLGGYHYPGNVRELRNIIEYGVNICRGEIIEVEHLPPYVIADAGKPPRLGSAAGPATRRESGARTAAGAAEDIPDNASSWSAIEKKKILTALMQTGGSRTGAAKALGWGRTTLWRKMKEYELG